MSTNSDNRQPSLTALAQTVETSTDSLERLAALRELADLTSRAVRATALAALAAGVPVASVGRALSITRQAAHKRFVSPQGGDKKPAHVAIQKKPLAWGELRLGPGRGLYAGRILRRT